MGREPLLLPPPTTPIPPSTTTVSNLPLAVSAPSASATAAPPTSLAPGFRFHPTDEELVIYYLKRKVSGKPFRFDAIAEVDIYKSEPWDLSDKSRLKTRDQEWYFFSALDKKYGNGGRMNRATLKGYWKATGNDRPVKHDLRTVGLKKTLVFHSGRAPDGKRTNWVMHEYRLVEEEMERVGNGSSQPQDAYVLCRVFHKNNIGPPNGQRYAPFVEEEWEDGSGMVPGAELVCNGPLDRPLRIEYNNGGPSCSEGRKNVVQDTQSNNKTPLDVNKLPIETQNLLAVCKRESMTEFSSPEKDDSKRMHVDDEYPSPQTDNPKPLPLPQIYKRRRYNMNSNHSNVSGDSFPNSQDPCSSTITTAATTAQATAAPAKTTNPAPKKHFLSALVEFSLLESLESKKENQASIQQEDFDLGNLESTVPPSVAKYIKHLQSETKRIGVEKETMRFELTSAQAMINILQSRVETLSKENGEMKKMMMRNP
ncbi:NAC domain containing protein [Trifolium repens]|nr:NAC domain containing protein [Trifolium repens]